MPRSDPPFAEPLDLLRIPLARCICYGVLNKNQSVCWKHWLIHHDSSNQDRAAAKIQVLVDVRRSSPMFRVALRTVPVRDSTIKLGVKNVRREFGTKRKKTFVLVLKFSVGNTVLHVRIRTSA